MFCKHSFIIYESVLLCIDHLLYLFLQNCNTLIVIPNNSINCMLIESSGLHQTPDRSVHLQPCLITTEKKKRNQRIQLDNLLLWLISTLLESDHRARGHSKVIKIDWE